MAIDTTNSATGTILISNGTNIVATTATYPAASVGTGKILRDNGTNFVTSTSTYPDTATGTGKVLIADGTNWVASTPTFPNTATGTGTLLRADGTNWVATTSTYPATNAINTLLYASSANVMTALATANSGLLVTSSGGVPSIGTAIPSGVTATTQAAANNSTSVATTAYADNYLSSSVFNSAGFVNKFINPGFVVQQRGTSGAITTSGAYTVDGWFVITTGANGTWSLTNSSPYPTSLNLVGAASVTDITMYQRIEGSVASQFYDEVTGGGRNVTLSFDILNATGATVTPLLTVSYANSLDNWGASTVDLNAVSMVAVTNGTAPRISYTWTPSGTYINGIEVKLDFGNNFSTSGKSVSLRVMDLRLTSSFATGTGNTAPIAEIRPIGIELPLCQRYFETSYPNKTAPGSVGISYVQKYPVGAASAAFMTNTFKFQKRAVPTVAYWDGAGNASKTSTYIATGVATDNVAAAVAPANISVNGFDWGSTAGVAIVGTGLAWSASAEL